MQSNLNIYCDESRVENPDSSKMVIGALFVPRNQKPAIEKKIKAVYKKYNFTRELKWVKTDKLFVDFYKEIIDYFIEEAGLNYRCIVVDKTKVRFKEFHNNDPELAFFKFYYFMLRSKLLNQNKYYISIDKKPTRDKNRARALKSFLDTYVLIHRSRCNIKHLQAYSSKENVFLQLTDYLTGLVGFACNPRRKSKSVKAHMVNHLKSGLGEKSLCVSTPLAEEKFNVFVWEGKQ